MPPNPKLKKNPINFSLSYYKLNYFILYFINLTVININLNNFTMKKIFLMLAIMLTISISAQVTGPKITYAAVGNLLSEPTHPATDTITNATVKYQYAIVNGSNVHFTIQSNLTKISGTVAGTVKPQGSVDGVTYFDITGQTAFTLTDVASQSCAFPITPSIYQYYRVVVTPSGTQSTKIASLGLVRKY